VHTERIHYDYMSSLIGRVEIFIIKIPRIHCLSLYYDEAMRTNFEHTINNKQFVLYIILGGVLNNSSKDVLGQMWFVEMAEPPFLFPRLALYLF
jgi:hypothetical protein